MQESSKQVVLEILKKKKPQTILDAPCGKGWLAERLGFSSIIDGIDLYEPPSSLYRKHYCCDLDRGLPDALPCYDAILSCEGIEHLGNPALFLKDAALHLKPGGFLILTTPSVWYPEARLQYVVRGFFPGFPCLVGKIQKGEHMHIMPWSFPHLYLYLKMHHFVDITLHEEPLSQPKRWYEKTLGVLQKHYCRKKAAKSEGETQRFWQMAGSDASLYGRHLIVTAYKLT